VRARVGLRPYRILARLAAPRESETTEHHAPATPLMLLNVLGRFRCEIAGQPVTFARRRDRQLFVFVALAPDGRTSRDRLLEAFWPGVDRATACQSLRPALNRIRRAIHDAAPSVDPDRYFRTAGEVAIDTRTVAVDVRRFIDRVEQGRLDDARSSVDGAKHHYRAAHRVYADRLLAAEGAEPCLERRVDELETLYVEVLTRLTELCAATGELETARGYADELLTRNNDEVRRREGALGASA
jgi:DNA-binding SARP family transcriptional activator